MPWELDYALLSFTQLKKSKYYIDDKDSIYIDVTLNLSDYLINWKDTSIPKSFFIDKFKSLQPLLKDYICNFKIYDGDQLYGGLNTIYESTEEHIDHYIILNPDMYFSENLLFYLIESSKHINNEYFIITPQIPKGWDKTWDLISNSNYSNVEHKDWNNLDVYDIRNHQNTQNNPIELIPLNIHKWAGWCDLYNKKMWENFWSNNWDGYGECDHYTMQLSQFAKFHGVDIQQYVLKNQIVYEYESGPLKNKNLSNYYKKQIVMNDIPNQRKSFFKQLPYEYKKGIKKLINKNIIPNSLKL